MAIGISELKTVSALQFDQLQSLHTGTLLTRLKALRSLHECEEQADWTNEEKLAVRSSGLIAFKSEENWKLAFADVKAVLATREHIPRGGKQARQERAQQKQRQ
ncbi:hypothetical protein PsAD13_00394 [Pseudovibrio sp. Ad13]|jgi:hypothetical protein|uniref:hypothetical protein n=1 Tax=Pseudovibrio sp. Ad13 TaxID=989396 RepID=UPI0007AE9DFF|nr:hypothetical protein [Pseudovibrio sp. Ad13]KZK87126.1 hypothetical protein PsAD13_00394 [Pseudovibrio sp. Ad13]